MRPWCPSATPDFRYRLRCRVHFFVRELLPAAAAKYLEGFKEHMLRDEKEVQELEARLGPVVGHVDPVLRNCPRVYASLVRRLVRVGMVRLSLKARICLGAFCVKKKGGKIRLILDCRPSNRVFRPPPGVELLTGEGLGRIEWDSGSWARDYPEHAVPDEASALWVANGDVQDYFHRLLLDDTSEIGEYLSYPPILARHLGITCLDGREVAPDYWIYPLSRSLPMGWSWLLYFAQTVSRGNATTLMLVAQFGDARSWSPACFRCMFG